MFSMMFFAARDINWSEDREEPCVGVEGGLDFMIYKDSISSALRDVRGLILAFQY